LRFFFLSGPCHPGEIIFITQVFPQKQASSLRPDEAHDDVHGFFDEGLSVGHADNLVKERVNRLQVSAGVDGEGYGRFTELGRGLRRRLDACRRGALFPC